MGLEGSEKYHGIPSILTNDLKKRQHYQRRSICAITHTSHSHTITYTSTNTCTHIVSLSLSYTKCKIIGQTEIQGQLIHTLSTVCLPVIFKILNISCTGFVAQNTLVTLHSVLRFTIISHRRKNNKTNQSDSSSEYATFSHLLDVQRRHLCLLFLEMFCLLSTQEILMACV